MHNQKPAHSKGFGSKRIGHALIGMGAVALVGLSTWSLAIASNDALACDVTSGATCKVIGVKTTLTSATISWTENEHGSSRYFCYGIGSPSKCALVQSRAKGAKDQVVTGLTPQTQYAYKFYGVHSGKTLSIVTGNFTTIDGYVCGSSVVTTVEVDGTTLTASGDSLENVIVQISRQSDGMVMGQDTTNPSGSFHFKVDPGTYLVTCSYPPFTAPPPYTAVVIINKTLTIPDRIFTGAFQVTGTVVSPGNVDSIAGATVTMINKNDNTQSYTRVTDLNGHFAFGLKTGDYLINVAYAGKTLPAPLSVSVGGSMKMADLVLSTTIGIRPALNHKNYNSWSIPGLEGYDAKGAQRPEAASSQERIFYNTH